MEVFSNEEELRNWIINELRSRINAKNLNFQVLDSKNVNDIVICKESKASPLVFFIEVKLYKRANNRIGIGQGKQDKKGEGFQPEILIKRPLYFEKYLRWVLCSEDGECIFANNERVLKYIAGGKVAKGKQNNINASIFNEKAVDLLKLIDDLLIYIDTA